MGATIHQHTPVTGIERTHGGEWIVRTAQGEIRCEHVICATGNYARSTAAMVGLQIPAIPVEHQYVVFDVDPVLEKYRAEGHKELPILREPDERYYFREERRGWILGPYEKHAPACFVDGVPATLREGPAAGRPRADHGACRGGDAAGAVAGECRHQADRQRADLLHAGRQPDGRPGFRLPNFWISEGHSFGITAAGGAGWQLANWIVDGEPSVDMIGVDPRRFGVVGKRFAKLKNEEAYEHVFVTHFPQEERPACRPAKAPPIYDRLDAARARSGASASAGSGRMFFAPEGSRAKDHWSFRRAALVRHRRRRGARHARTRRPHGAELVRQVRGRGAGRARLGSTGWSPTPCRRRWAAWRCAMRSTRSGSVRSEFTVTRLADGLWGERFYLVGPGAAHDYDWDFLQKACPRDGSVFIKDVTTQYGVLIVAGPQAREVLAGAGRRRRLERRLPLADGAGDPGRLLPGRAGAAGQLRGLAGLGAAPPDRVPAPSVRGAAARPAGRTTSSWSACAPWIRCGWRRATGCGAPTSTPRTRLLEAGMDRFIRFQKPDFTGREALLRQKEQGIPWRYSTIEIDADDADSFGNEPVYDRRAAWSAAAPPAATATSSASR